MTLKKAFSLFVFLAAGLSAHAYDDGDWQFWNTDAFEYKLTDTAKLSFETEFYFGDDMTDFYYWHVQPGASVRPAKWMEVGTSFRHLEEKKSGEWMTENRPAVFVSPIATLGGWEFSDRNQIEYRSREEQDDTWRYRNRIRAVAPFKLTKIKIQPYVDEEIYVDLDTKVYNQNRASAGIQCSPLKFLKVELYYMNKQDLKSGDWTESNILGTKIRFVF